MNRIFLPLCCAALALASASCTQAGGAATTSPGAKSAPHAGVGPVAKAVTVPARTPAAGNAAPPTAAATNQQPAAPASPASGVTPKASSGPPAAPVPAAPVIARDRRASSLIGLRVESASGEPLGFVEDIIFNRNGRATHLVIAFGDEGNGGKLTAVPWAAAVASLHGNHLVFDGRKLQAAPSFLPGRWPNIATRHWSAAADAYWRGGTGPAKPQTVAPVDSTARTRSRPTRPN